MTNARRTMIQRRDERIERTRTPSQQEIADAILQGVDDEIADHAFLLYGNPALSTAYHSGRDSAAPRMVWNNGRYNPSQGMTV